MSRVKTKQEEWRARTGFTQGEWTKGYQSGYCAGRNNRTPKKLDGTSSEYRSAYLQGYEAGQDRYRRLSINP